MIIFTHIPKTAGTTLKYILRNNFGIKHIDSAKVKSPVYSSDDLKFALKIFRHPQAISGHNLVDPQSNVGKPEAQLITILRDPINRCASHYQDAVLRGNLRLSFEKWIDLEENQDLSVKIIAGSDDIEKAKLLLKESYRWVGITERFNESLKLLNILIDEPLNLQYRRMITASNNDIKQRLLSDKASLDLLNKHNALDKELYDFAIREIFLPAMVQHKEALDKITLPEEIRSNQKDFRYKRSVGYNKYVYRQLIKLFQH